MSFLSLFRGADSTDNLEDKLNEVLEKGAKNVVGFGLGYTDNKNKGGFLFTSESNENRPYKVKVFSAGSDDAIQEEANAWLRTQTKIEIIDVSLCYATGKSRFMILYTTANNSTGYTSLFLKDSNAGGMEKKVTQAADAATQVWALGYTAGDGKHRVGMIIT